jgi:ABC-2 type transport system ATP-binding protein
MNDLAILTQDLTREFGTVRAVDGLTLTVPAGQVFGFLGPNGSGKTTTIRLLLGLLEPTRGSARVLGYDVRTQAQDIRERSGALLEQHGLYERLSAENNLDFYGRVWRLAAGERRARVKELLGHLGLWGRRHEPVAGWSRGMKQKLAVARALLHRPRLIFLDEPTAGLDPIGAAALRDELAALVAREGVTVFITTHNLAEAEKLCDQVGVIHQGRLLAAGSPAALRARGARPQLVVRGRGLTPAVLEAARAWPTVSGAAIDQGQLVIDLGSSGDAAGLVSRLVSAGVEVEEARRESASLEQAFLSLVEEDSPPC